MIKKVCKQPCALITSSLIIEYRIELAAAGLVNGPPGGPAPTPAARLHLLLLGLCAARRALHRGVARICGADGTLRRVRICGGRVRERRWRNSVWRDGRWRLGCLSSSVAGGTRLVVGDLSLRVKQGLRAQPGARSHRPPREPSPRRSDHCQRELVPRRRGRR